MGRQIPGPGGFGQEGSEPRQAARKGAAGGRDARPESQPQQKGAGNGHRVDARQGPRLRVDDPGAERHAPRRRRDPLGNLHRPREGHVQRERQEGRSGRSLDARTGARTERRAAGRRHVQRHGRRPLGTRNRQQTRTAGPHAGHYDPEARDARRDRPPHRHRLVQGAEHHRQGTWTDRSRPCPDR